MTSSPDAATEQWWHPSSDSDQDWLTWANALPFLRDLGVECVSLNSESAVFTMPRSTLSANPNGAVNGGILSAAADQVMGVLTRRCIGADRLPATASLHVQYHAAAMAPLTLRVRMLGGGPRVRFVEVVIEDRDGLRCATSQATMISRGATQVAPE